MGLTENPDAESCFVLLFSLLSFSGAFNSNCFTITCNEILSLRLLKSYHCRFTVNLHSASLYKRSSSGLSTKPTFCHILLCLRVLVYVKAAAEPGCWQTNANLLLAAKAAPRLRLNYVPSPAFMAMPFMHVAKKMHSRSGSPARGRRHSATKEEPSQRI